MALNAYLTMVAEKQGLIRGSVVQRDREDKIMVIGVSHEIVCPRDPTDGQPTGKRIHKPLVIIKEVDRSSPLLYRLLVDNENIKDWVLQFWTPSATGVERQHYTIRLVNATVSGVHTKMPSTRSPKLAKLAQYEEVSFVYQKIEWTWTTGNITTEDDWGSPR